LGNESKYIDGFLLRQPEPIIISDKSFARQQKPARENGERLSWGYPQYPIFTQGLLGENSFI